MLTRELQVDRRYLILPVSRRPPTGARSLADGHMRLRAGGEVVRHFDIDLAEGDGDYQVFSDLQPFLGQRLTAEFEGSGAASLDGLRLAAEPVPPHEVYRERLRPQFHFSSRRGWNNDPNGLFFFGGEYHLLYQHNPYSVEWGNLHWGHAVSRDLVHWTELPAALYPDELGAMSTGCAVVDQDNTSGLGHPGAPAVVAIYTAGHASWTPGFVQCLAISTDGGYTWSKYDGNPVIDQIVHRNRDPKVIWHPESERWVMVLYMAATGTHRANGSGYSGAPTAPTWWVRSTAAPSTRSRRRASCSRTAMATLPRPGATCHRRMAAGCRSPGCGSRCRGCRSASA